MVGKVTLPNGAVITLTDGRRLRITGGQELEEHVTQEFRRYLEDYSVSNGAFGPKFLHDLAEELGGELHLEEKPKPPPGTIY